MKINNRAGLIKWNSALIVEGNLHKDDWKNI